MLRCEFQEPVTEPGGRRVLHIRDPRLCCRQAPSHGDGQRPDSTLHWVTPAVEGWGCACVQYGQPRRLSSVRRGCDCDCDYDSRTLPQEFEVKPAALGRRQRFALTLSGNIWGKVAASAATSRSHGSHGPPEPPATHGAA
ncbi:hypothetical protein COCVIDRAFT_112227 [Bipolaris victoriae FI3]|uniref:Uncharacterized protein n=1 Tax=Bipolaris victoriae (strain FI3) TaxID=930091 RepID=W7EDA9_BIPV3|nr:hypothetical protein COCVIDRAFT_112227 [Bipolaris victoriae FI3]